MRIFFNQLSGRLKLAASVFERTLTPSFQLQRNIHRYACSLPAILKSSFEYPLVSCTCSHGSQALISPYQRSVRWYSPQCKPTEISYEDLLELIDEGGIIVDVRPEKEAIGNGLIPQAKNIPLEELKEALSRDPEDFQRIYGMAKPTKKEEKLVFYATGPVKSSTAVELARKIGFKKARHYPGGWKEWSEKQVQFSKCENN